MENKETKEKNKKDVKQEEPKVTKTRGSRFDKDTRMVVMTHNILVERPDGSQTTTKMEDRVPPHAAHEVFAKLHQEKQGHTNNIKALKAQIDVKLEYSDEELEKLNKMSGEVQAWVKKKNAELQLKQAELSLKEVNKGILELEPTIKKLPKKGK